MTSVPPQAAPWYGWAIALEISADRGRDGRPVIELGRAMARELHLPPAARDRVFVLDGIASFVRACTP